MLRGEPVVDGDHDRAGAVGHHAGDVVLAVQVPEDPPAAVEEDRHGQPPGVRRVGREVDADGDLDAFGGGHGVVHAADRLGVAD